MIRPACFDCHRAPARPGGWRCAACQARVDMRKATAKLAGQSTVSPWRRRLSPVDTLDREPAPVVRLPYHDD